MELTSTIEDYPTGSLNVTVLLGNRKVKKREGGSIKICILIAGRLGVECQILLQSRNETSHFLRWFLQLPQFEVFNVKRLQDW